MTHGSVTRPLAGSAMRVSIPAPSRYASGVVALVAVGVVVRLAFLGQLPLWRDEAFTGVLARESWGAMLDAVRRDSGPPLGYLLSHLAAQLSADPQSLRLVSALAGAAGIPVCAALGRRLGGSGAGLAAGALWAVAPELVILGRDARMYALATTATLTCALTLWRAVESPRRGRLTVHAASVALALYTHYLTAVAIAVQLAAAGALGSDRRARRAVGVASVLGAVTTVPWLVAASAQLQHTAVPFWLPRATWTATRTAVLTLLRGTASRDVVLAHSLDLFALVIWTGAVVATLVALRHRDTRSGFTYLLGAGVGGTAVVLLASLRQPLLDARYLAVVACPAIAALGAGLAHLRPRAVTAASLAGLLAATATTLGQTTRTDWRPVAAWLDSHLGPGDTALIDSPDYLLLLYYGTPRVVSRTHVLNRHGPAWYWGTAAYPPAAVVRQLPPASKTIYVFLADFPAGVPLPPGYVRTSTWCRTWICIGGFQPRGTPTPVARRQVPTAGDSRPGMAGRP